MPTAGDYSLFKAQLLIDVKAAWPDVRAVHFGWPRAPQKDLPYAVCVLNKVVSDLGGQAASVNSAHQGYEWVIIYVSQPPQVNVNLMDYKVEKGDALALLLEASTTYAGVGMLPVAAEIDYSERWEFPNSEGACTVTVTFASVVRREWGT